MGDVLFIFGVYSLQFHTFFFFSLGVGGKVRFSNLGLRGFPCSWNFLDLSCFCLLVRLGLVFVKWFSVKFGNFLGSLRKCVFVRWVSVKFGVFFGFFNEA